jgi:gas vesicle protein
VNERAAIWLGALAGAVVGGALGYLYLSDRGRELREDLEPAVSDLMTELRRSWEAAEHARQAMSEAWTAAPVRDDTTFDAGRL